MIWYSRDENGVETPLTVSGGQTIQVNEMPAASSDYVGIVCQYIGETTVNYTHNYFYECIEDTSTNPATYSWVPTNVQAGDGSSVQADWDQADSSADDYIKNKPTIPGAIQYSTMPTASAVLNGAIVQYTGTTDSNYTNGYFYKCKFNGSAGRYSWIAIDVSNIDTRLNTELDKKQNKIIQSNTFTLDKNSWTYNNSLNAYMQTITVNTIWIVNNSIHYKNIINIPYNMDIWSINGIKIQVQAYSGYSHENLDGTDYTEERINTITFSCVTVPSSNLTFNITCIDVGDKDSELIYPIINTSFINDITTKEIANTATGTSITLTDSADGYLQGVTVKGHSEKSKNIWDEDYTGINEYGVVYRSIYVANGTYTMSTTAPKNINDAADLFFLAGNVSTGGSTSINGVWTGHSITVTTSDNYLTVAYRINNASDIADPRNHKTQIELGSTATSYEPFGIKSIGDAGWGVVDLGTLTYTKLEQGTAYAFRALIDNSKTYNAAGNSDIICSKFPFGYATTLQSTLVQRMPDKTFGVLNDAETHFVYFKDTNYTDAATFKSAMSGVLLYYPLADTTGATPILGITSKNGAGQGTAATITTGLPLHSVSDSIYDTLDNEKVTKKCAEVDLGDLTWTYIANTERFLASLQGATFPVYRSVVPNIISEKYNTIAWADIFEEPYQDMCISGAIDESMPYISIRDTAYTDATAFTTAVTGVKLVYPLATPIETPLTSAEKSALASLRTYDHTTHIDATDAPTMTVDYLLNTNNGQAVADIQRDLQEQIDDTGWKLLTLASGITTINVYPEDLPRIRKIGNVVYIRGQVDYSSLPSSGGSIATSPIVPTGERGMYPTYNYLAPMINNTSTPTDAVERDIVLINVNDQLTLSCAGGLNSGTFPTSGYGSQATVSLDTTICLYPHS